MPDTTAQIAAKGCNTTGITEDLAAKLHDQLGKKLVCVVELVSETRSENREGKEKVGLSILTIEPAPNADTENHLRELARCFHYERQLADGQLQIETRDDLEPKVADVIAAGKRHEPHLFVDSHDADTCDVCGDPTTAPVHQILGGPDEDPDDDQGTEQDVDNTATDELDLDNPPTLNDDEPLEE